MPSGLHKMQVEASVEELWKFVSVMDIWAPLVPGYMEHEIFNDKESTWKFKTEVGFLKKKIHLKVNITDWKEPSMVTFNLTGINERFHGQGYFRAEAIGTNSSTMTGYLEINAEGPLAKMVNPLLNSILPEMTTELTEAVAYKVEGIYSSR
ncbi:CoxG family protein [Rossellomorea aquimaris]|uniref:SRPBCC family protein n=1 Tax=Rossellomorea aquimaris TaxID=189382 RepID=A0A5D4U6C9_9BACI|nr:SRPBCC family protein [Rossellomorea aquimaris]TYS82896.1 SRPBCC family protein [Rossellomorea aquimaris]